MTQNLLLETARGNWGERAPVWVMRQAGRYLPEYRALREKYNFSTMYKNPELAAEVTLQPIERLGVDGAILFTDILVVPEAMGMELHFSEGKGPIFNRPIRSEKDLENLKTIQVEEALPYVYKSLEMVRSSLPDHIATLGFCGAPWTLATYMIEGGASKNYRYIKEARFGSPDFLKKLLDRLTDVLIEYTKAKVAHGAQVIQIFDTWAGILDEKGFSQFALPYVKRIVTALKETNTPVIYFAKGGGTWLETLPESGADVLALDWTMSPERARKILGPHQIFQGNLDPTALYAPVSVIESMAGEMVRQFGPHHIANLGHGILPDIPVEHAQAFVGAVKRESQKHYQTLKNRGAVAALCKSRGIPEPQIFLPEGLPSP